MSAPSILGYILIQNEIQAAGDGKTVEITDGLLSSVLPTIWSLYNDKGLIHPRLQFLYAKRQAIDFWMTSVWRDVDYEEEVHQSLGQQSRNLGAIRTDLDNDIAALEAEVKGTGSYLVGTLVTTSSLPPSPCQPDPAAPRYGGDARWRRWPY